MSAIYTAKVRLQNIAKSQGHRESVNGSLLTEGGEVIPSSAFNLSVLESAAGTEPSLIVALDTDVDYVLTLTPVTS
jgi:hypothetical protein